jgi:bacterioferritin
MDFEAIRDGALLGMADGPVTPGYDADAPAVVAVLNALLATAAVDWLRYWQHATVVAGPTRGHLARCFAEYATAELGHVTSLAARIGELGGVPDLDPEHLEMHSHTAYRTYPGTDMTGMLRENLLAARIVIDVCRETIRWLDSADSTTRRLVETILECQESHAGNLRDLLAPSAG